MSRAAQELLDRLARAVGGTAPQLPSDGPAFDVAPDGALLELTGPSLAGELEERIGVAESADSPEAAAAWIREHLEAALRRTCGAADDAPVTLAASPEELLGHWRDGVATAGKVLACGTFRSLDDRFDSVDHADPAAIEASLLEGDAKAPAALLLAPRSTSSDNDDLAPLVALTRAAAASGLPVLLDETGTCGRLAAGCVAAETDLQRDAVLVGPSLAAGLPFAALIGQSIDTSDTPPPPADPTCQAIALATLSRLAARPIHEDLANSGKVLVARFAAQCKADDLDAELRGPTALPAVHFAGQENAEAPLMLHHFNLELAAQGLRTGGALLAPPARAAQAEPLAERVAAAAARIRTLLIEHNSYLSGGIPWNFPTEHSPAAMCERGVARYRYPRLGNVDVDATDAGIRIAFSPGELGPITSSGCYLPTLLTGDLDIRVDFEVEHWDPGPDSACLGLFLQNVPSTARYYAQLMSTADRPGERSVAAGLDGVVSGRRLAPGEHGGLRITREGSRVTAWHRIGKAGDGDSGWEEIDHSTAASTDDVLCGAKIWSKVRCGGLVVHLTGLSVQATLADEQLPLLDPRPDPRH